MKCILAKVDLIILMHLTLFNGLIGAVLTKQKGLLFALTTIALFNILNNVLGLLQPIIKKINFKNTSLVISLTIADILAIILLLSSSSHFISMYLFLILYNLLVAYINCIGTSLDFRIYSKIANELSEKELENYMIQKHTIINAMNLIGVCLSYILALITTMNVILFSSLFIILANFHWIFKLYKIFNESD